MSPQVLRRLGVPSITAAVLLLVWSVTVIASASEGGPADLRAVQFEPLLSPGPPIEICPDGAASVLKDSEAACNGEWHGPASQVVLNWYAGNEYYAVYQEPEETGCVNTYPFAVEHVYWWLQNSTLSDFSLTVQPVIYTADLTNPLCPVPGVAICRGPLYAVNMPAGGAGIVTMEMLCCVSGPYFVGVYCPTSVSIGSMDIIIDAPGDGGGLFPERECASYNNKLGSWQDLVVDAAFPGNLKLWTDGTNADGGGCDTCAVTITPGVDLWQTDRDGDLIPPDVFSAYPIPADFFGPGSDPFDGLIFLEGLSLVTDPSDMLSPADAVIERTTSTTLPIDGSAGTITTEIVALSLVSTEPIMVTSWGGASVEFYDVQVCLSMMSQPPGSIDLTRVCCEGGTFVGSLPVLPQFIFLAPTGGPVATLDWGMMGQPPIYRYTPSGVWSTEVHPPYGILTSPGLVEHDHDCNPQTPAVVINQSSQFLRCEQPADNCFPDPCATTCCIPTTVGDMDQSGGVDITDLSILVDNQFLTLTPLVCYDEGNLNYPGTGYLFTDTVVDITDLSILIDNQFLTLAPLAPCP